MRTSASLLLALVLAAFSSAFADPGAQPGDIYLKGYVAKDQAERLEKSGDLRGALQKFQEAQQLIASVARDFPTWQAEVVGYRLSKIQSDIARLSSKAGPATLSAPAPSPVMPIPAPVAPLPQAVPTPQSGTLDQLQREIEKAQQDIQDLKRQLKEYERHLNSGPETSSQA